jgi:ketosteroid isomerase-like protein
MVASLFLAIAIAAPLWAQDIEAIHNDIRAMRDRTIAAFEARDREAFLAQLSDNVYFTAMNNEAVHGKEEAAAYYDRMMNAADGLISDLQVDFQSDVLSALYADNTTAVATGTSDSTFKMRGGLEFSMPLRWTAVLTRDSGEWQISGMHFSANIFDNPLDTGLRKYLWLMLAGVGVVALVLGYLLGRMRAR